MQRLPKVFSETMSKNVIGITLRYRICGSLIKPPCLKGRKVRKALNGKVCHSFQHANVFGQHSLKGKFPNPIPF